MIEKAASIKWLQSSKISISYCNFRLNHTNFNKQKYLKHLISQKPKTSIKILIIVVIVKVFMIVLIVFSSELIVIFVFVIRIISNMQAICTVLQHISFRFSFTITILIILIFIWIIHIISLSLALIIRSTVIILVFFWIIILFCTFSIRIFT